MSTSALRSIGALIGAAAVVTASTTTGPADATVEKGPEDRPCFMVRSTWNTAEGPQPTCPNGRFGEAPSHGAGAIGVVRPGRIVDYRP